MGETKTYQILSKILSPVFLDALANNDKYMIDEYSQEIRNSGIINSNKSSVIDFMTDCYSLFCSNYRNEHVYRNIVFEKLVMQSHDLKTCTVFPEFRVSKSIADLVVFNGTTTAYEIKTELDSIIRLESQIKDYLKCFDKVYIVTHQSFFERILKIVPDSIGIYILEDDLDLTLVREALSNRSNVCQETIFKTFRQQEYVSIITNRFGTVEDLISTQVYPHCKELFTSLSKEEAHSIFLETIRSRNMSDYHIGVIEKWPAVLKSLTLSKRYSKQKWNNLHENLSKTLIIR